MPVEARPLFRLDVLRPFLATFQPARPLSELTETIRRWVDMLAAPDADRLNEREILPDFLSDIFCGILGYSRKVDSPDRFTFSREKHVQVDGKYADAVLGVFQSENEQFVVAVEGKGPTDPLDRPFAGRRMSAVDQAYRYAINLRCDWVIVTSMRQTRLYHKGSDQHTFERFDIQTLADDEFTLRKFIFLLGAERVVPPRGVGHFEQLLAASEQIGRDLTIDFYQKYAEMRQQAFEQLIRDNDCVPRPAVLSATQKLLDRVLFCCFAEDRGLLPRQTVEQAYTHADPYNPRPVYDNFRGLFRAINLGNNQLAIPAYNGGLFADDALLDSLHVPDEVCQSFKELADYDYRPGHEANGDRDEFGGKQVDVEILGHIFEQSITDLERLRDEIEGRAAPQMLDERVSRRRREGAFYTPSFVTRFIVSQCLGSVLADRFEALRRRHAEGASGTAKSCLTDPRAYDPTSLNRPQKTALTRFWEDWQAELGCIRVLDPACGSGAFLIEAFHQLHAAYEQVNDRLQEVRGHRSLFDLDRQILQNNLFGVDLNEEAIEICRLSLWIKTAARGKPLTSLDNTICVGNSIVADPSVAEGAFDWQSRFKTVFDNGGFDVVVGNPPYVRQQLLTLIKPYLKANYAAYDGTADLYVYFFELGLRVLRPGGRLGFIVTNKWMRAGYGEALRRHFAEQSWIESVIDFGHAKQIFPDADVFPGILIVRKPDQQLPTPTSCRVCVIPREQLRIEDLLLQVASEGVDVPLGRFSKAAWNLEPPDVTALMQKIKANGVPLRDYIGGIPYRGILTGFNDAFLLDTSTKEALLAADPNSASLLRPYLRGQDIDRWQGKWNGLWMLAIKSSGNYSWPWSDAGDQAEDVFRKEFPAVHAHLDQFREALIRRQDQGRFWWELRACSYWDAFDRPKIMYQEIQFHPCYLLDTRGWLSNNKAFFLSSDDLYLLAVLNSPLMWWHNWRYLPHMKDEALSPVGFLMEDLPIAQPPDEVRVAVETAVRRLIALTEASVHACDVFIDWLKVEYDIAKPNNKLLAIAHLTEDELIAEVRKLRGRSKPLSPALLRSLRDGYVQSVPAVQQIQDEARILELRLADLVNSAFSLKPEDVSLMWESAPPRMPGNRP